MEVFFLTACDLYPARFRTEEGFAAFNEELFLRKPIHKEDLITEINRLFSYS